MANRRDLTDRKHREARRRFLAASNGICVLCHEPIDMSLPGRHPRGPIVEHLIAVARGGHPTDPKNKGVAHRECGLRKGIKLMSELDNANQWRTEHKGTRDWL